MRTIFIISALLINLTVTGQNKPFVDSLISPNFAIIELDTSFWGKLFENHSKTNLNQDELRKLDSILNICINDNNNDGQGPGIIGKHIGNSNFVKQYIPSINKKGEKIVWVNCLCYGSVIDVKRLTKKEIRKNKKLGIRPKQEIVSIDYSWKQKFIIVADGGGCFFNVKINLSTLSYFDLYVNGI